MTATSSPELLVLHSVRILGFADTPVIAHRFGVDTAQAEELLLDAQACGWIQRGEFADVRGWSLTELGRTVNEHQLREEREATGRTDVVRSVYRSFLPLNERLLRACTDWQLRPTDTNRLTVNDHSDRVWDQRILDELASIGDALSPLVDQLSSAFARFAGYDSRFGAASRLARAGEHNWVDRTDVDSCHKVWFELHEDLIATLGIDRRSESGIDDSQ
ncbi:transcriptional regulator [Rhodococcoides fascians A25f]|uniref:hypothetical protein n=1 Tax=Rhodococcoides fascians TaxID=1828 RepID=UPI00055A1563|nr:hypothetical protein [Rhodococcus fascians]QII07718.1 transcriptional regulator [Rhodococcus fascians A25f]